MIPKYFKWLWLQENGKEFSSYIAIEGAQTLKTEAAGADDSINSMNQDKTHDTISGSAAHGCQRCMNEDVHDCDLPKKNLLRLDKSFRELSIS